MSALSLVRPDLLDFAPYVHAAPVFDAVRLHANEASWRHDWDDTPAGLNRYPDPAATTVVARLAEIYGTTSDRVLLGRGSDDAIDALTRLACAAGTDAVAICPPTFGMYAAAARLQGANVVEVPLRAERGFAVDPTVLVDAMAAATTEVKIVYLCSPNNPTGNTTALATIERICDALRGRAFVVVDEAYAEFAGGRSAVSLAPSYDNLVVLRTLSKAYALAGARLGVAVADPAIVRLLRGVLPPYPVPTASLDAAQQGLSANGVRRVQNEVAETRARRTALSIELARIGRVRRVWPSEANFLLVECDDADRVAATLRDAGILVRQFPQAPELGGCIRITVGTGAQNAALLRKLEDLD